MPPDSLWLLYLDSNKHSIYKSVIELDFMVNVTVIECSFISNIISLRLVVRLTTQLQVKWVITKKIKFNETAEMVDKTTFRIKWTDQSTLVCKVYWQSKIMIIQSVVRAVRTLLSNTRHCLCVMRCLVTDQAEKLKYVRLWVQFPSPPLTLRENRSLNPQKMLHSRKWVLVHFLTPYRNIWGEGWGGSLPSPQSISSRWGSRAPQCRHRF